MTSEPKNIPAKKETMLHLSILFKEPDQAVHYWTNLRSAAPTSFLQVFVPDDGRKPGSCLELVNIACAVTQIALCEYRSWCRTRNRRRCAGGEANLCLGHWAGRCWVWLGHLAAPPSIQWHTPSYRGWICTVVNTDSQWTTHVMTTTKQCASP